MKVSRTSLDGVHTAGRRRRGAFAFVALVLLVVALFGVITRTVFSGVLQKAVCAETWDVSPSGVLDELEGKSGGESKRDAPARFEEEVLSLEGVSEMRVDPRSAIVGFTSAKAADHVFKDASDELEARGWTFVDSGSNTCGTFVKEAGTYRWVFVSCVQVGSSTSVVVQSVLADEGK